MTKRNKPLVASVVLSWNSADFIAKALSSLSASSYKTDVLLVDNDSHDTTRELVFDQFPGIQQVNTGDNYGYAGGNNRGIKHLLAPKATSKPDYIFILNPDAYVAKDCIKKLVARMETEPELAVVSPKIYHDGTRDVWFGGSKIIWRSGVTSQPGGNDIGQFDQSRYTDRANGCAMLVRVSAIEKVGLMDERFFLYYEESDWSVSFSKAGYKIGFQPDAHTWHKTSSSTGGHLSPLYQYYMTRNKLLFVRKQKPVMLPIAILLSLVGSLRMVTDIRKRTDASKFRLIIRAISKGHLDFFINRLGRQLIPS